MSLSFCAIYCTLSLSDSIPDCGNDLATVFIVHKRELSDSRVESGSSLFYLLYCSAHDRLNTMTFRSFRNIPHGLHHIWVCFLHQTCQLCLSTSRTDCIPVPIITMSESLALPQHIPHGLHLQNRTDAMPQIHAICCELVDSFSDAAKAASALTIFPCSSTVKAIYIAIIDSLGRTIDRFFGANRTEKIC